MLSTSTAAFTETPTITPTSTQAPTITQTPTQTPTPVPSPTPIVLPTSYTIQSGDTLQGISEYFDVPIIFIALANNIENTNLIIAGDTLLIPDPDKLPEGLLSSGKKILVVLSEQKLYAFEDRVLLKEFLVSTGVAEHPTITGVYSIYLKLEKDDMLGDDYYLTDVPWTMYFYQGYGIHGTYWHNNFGYPMSHGCVNMDTDQAEWLFNWAPIGTEVEIIQ